MSPSGRERDAKAALLFAYDDHGAMLDEIRTRSINDLISELMVAREAIRALLGGNDAAAEYAALRWAKRWGTGNPA